MRAGRNSFRIGVLKLRIRHSAVPVCMLKEMRLERSRRRQGDWNCSSVSCVWDGRICVGPVQRKKCSSTGSWVSIERLKMTSEDAIRESRNCCCFS